ncbi:MAG TPA: hypothetical protein VN950_22885 [Terriglobales bacterium]|nr:hypothetical protein [Terriglobales bacterium]
MAKKTIHIFAILALGCIALDVLPLFAANDVGDLYIRNFKNSRNEAHSFTARESVSYLKDGILLEFASPISLPLGVSILRNSVSTIKAMSTGNQMIWSHARRIIAGMQNNRSVWNPAIVENERCMGCSKILTPLRVSTNHAVSIPVTWSTPQPTGISLCDVRPESLGEWLGFTRSTAKSLWSTFGILLPGEKHALTA